MKEGKENRVRRITHTLVTGEPWQLDEALNDSEYSKKINTSFIERLNLTIQQGYSYLRRRSTPPIRAKTVP